METIIRQIYAQYQIAKEQAARECEGSRLYNLAEKYRHCDMFKGTEDLQEIIRLFTSSRGLEFCMKFHFPNIATLRLFKSYNVERYGIYIDAGTITLENPKRAILIGHTNATIVCSTLERHHVALLHGSKTVISASDWAVVFVDAAKGCNVMKIVNDNAVII